MEDALAALIWLFVGIIGVAAAAAVVFVLAAVVVGVVTGIREGVAASRHKRAAKR